MLKLDKNLKKTRHQLVPDMVDEDDFWRNYFYKIECFKAEMGLENRLGSKISVQQRSANIREAQTNDTDIESTTASHTEKDRSNEEIEL